jgi:hypothetical protein
MIKLLFTFLFVCAGTVATFAQDTSNKKDQKDNDKQQITVSELPETIRASLTREDYIGWTVGNVFKKEKGGKIVYLVELSKGSETKEVKFNADGNKSNEKKKDKSNRR